MAGLSGIGNCRRFVWRRTTEEMVLKVGWFVALASILFAGICVAIATNRQIDKNETAQTKVTAHLAFADQDWEASEKKNREILQRNPKDGEAWFYLGLSQHYQKDYTHGRDAFYKAIAYGYKPGISYYNIACTHARQRNFDLAIKSLLTAKSHRFPVLDFAQDDPDMEELRQLPEFDTQFNRQE